MPQFGFVFDCLAVGSGVGVNPYNLCAKPCETLGEEACSTSNIEYFEWMEGLDGVCSELSDEVLLEELHSVVVVLVEDVHRTTRMPPLTHLVELLHLPSVQGRQAGEKFLYKHRQ